MEASSAINTSHPDDAGDEADKFFGEEESPNGDGETAAEPQAETTEEAKAETEVEKKAEETPAPKEQAKATEPTAAKKGSVERTYIVFQRVPLNKRALEHMLEEVSKGGEPRVVYMELDRLVARNDKQAIGDTYRTHRDSLGEKSTLAAVSSRAFRERSVQPKQRPVEETLDIS